MAENEAQITTTPARAIKGDPAITRTLRQARFLHSYRHDANITNAAKAAHVDRSAFYRWMAEDPAFKARVEAVAEEPVERIESVLYTRALAGEPWAVKMYLIAHKPQLYRNRVEIDMPTVERLAAELGLDPQEVMREAEAIMFGASLGAQ